MTAARAARLEALGFVWTPGHTGGAPREEEKLARLAAYKAEHGDCNVPRGWAEEWGLVAACSCCLVPWRSCAWLAAS